MLIITAPKGRVYPLGQNFIFPLVESGIRDGIEAKKEVKWVRIMFRLHAEIVVVLQKNYSSNGVKRLKTQNVTLAVANA